MTRPTFTATPAIHAAAGLIREIDRLRHADAELLKAATTAGERQAVRNARGRSRALRHALQRWLAAEVRAQRRPLRLDDD